MINLQLEVAKDSLVQSLAAMEYDVVQEIIQEVDRDFADIDFTYQVAVWFAKELKNYPEYMKDFLEEVQK